MPTGSRQAELDREGIPACAAAAALDSGLEHVYHRARPRLPADQGALRFYKLGKMKPGDEIFIEDKEGQKYTFRVYDLMTVEPNDYWTTYPVEGKTVVSLQSCIPIPTFENRLIVRGELVLST